MLKNHPAALPVCFTTEMWERFGYKIILGLLIFVLLQRFGFTDAQAAGVTGSFTGLLYITSILAGYIADHFIGYYRSVILGAIILIAGYLLLAISNHILLLSISLGTISVGTGLLKTNISSYLGASYQPGDQNRQKGYSIFYSGINFGSMLGNLTAGYFYHHYGSTVSFAIASIGILVGLLTFYYGFKLSGLKPLKSQLATHGILKSLCFIVVGITIATLVIYIPHLSILFFSCVTLASVLVVYKKSRCTVGQFKRFITFLLFLVIAILFFSIQNQMFLSMNLFINRMVIHSFLGIPMTTQAFIITNNISIIIFGITVTRLWSYLSDTMKYVLGMFSLCFVFIVVGMGIQSTSPMMKIAAYWVVIAYIILSFSEICISPIGLSLASKLAPEDGIGMFMGLWLVSSGLGGFLGGLIAKLAAIHHQDLNNMADMKSIYLQAFHTYTTITIVGFFITCLIALVIKRIACNDSL